MKLRPAQEEILKYRQGKFAVSAVPGSGKTFTLSLLAAELLSKELIEVDHGQSVLIVTYLNATVEHFRAGIRRQLDRLNLPQVGFDVRTLHSLAYEIVQLAEVGFVGGGSSLSVLDMSQSNRFLTESAAKVINQYPDLWHDFIGDDSPGSSAKWRRIVENLAANFIKSAKNRCFNSEQIIARLDQNHADSEDLILLRILAEIYSRYQRALERNGVYDFDDLIWRAVSLVSGRSDLRSSLAERWPYVLEDEAQDSIPLQEELLGQITSTNQNWVRVGDPNQAITSSFTSAHPRFFTNFLKRKDVTSVTLANSGRSAPKIMNVANALVDWACSDHPLLSVRKKAFLNQKILPTPEGDAQPNPSDKEAAIEIKVFGDRDDNEIPQVALKAHIYSRNNPEHTIAILVPTNGIGQRVAENLVKIDANFDDRLRRSGRGRKAIVAISSILSLLSDSSSSRHFIGAYETFLEFGDSRAAEDSVDHKRIRALLKSVVKSEDFLFPESHSVIDSLPKNVAGRVEIEILNEFSRFLYKFFLIQPLPYDDLILAISERLFLTNESEAKQEVESNMAIAYQLAGTVRSWIDQYADWRLPEIVDQLRELSLGRSSLSQLEAGLMGYEPIQGRITLTTQHSAKGMEWDAVFIIGLDSFWLPISLDDRFMGFIPEFNGDPKAETNAMLDAVMKGEKASVWPIDATESAHIEVICERLRLIYVGITRAKRYLHLSRSSQITSYHGVEYCQPSKALEVIYNQLSGHLNH